MGRAARKIFLNSWASLAVSGQTEAIEVARASGAHRALRSAHRYFDLVVTP